MATPLVSICCITYNHAPFIRQCLDGFLMQKTSFPIEILIHDDCSTDGTTEIVKEYAAKYPDLIFPMYETENQYSKPNRQPIDFYNYRRARGKYIAYCEGDDYWTDPLKLQKQVDFMEANPEYSLCVHGIEVHDLLRGRTYRHQYDVPDGIGVDITPAIYFTQHYVQPLSMVFRRSMFSFDWSKRYHGYRDTHEIYHLLKAGKGRFMNFYGGVYTKHQGGICSSIGNVKNCLIEQVHTTELYKLNPEDRDVLQPYLKSILLWCLAEYHSHRQIKYYWHSLYSILIETPEVFCSVFTKEIHREIKQMFKKIKN